MRYLCHHYYWRGTRRTKQWLCVMVWISYLVSVWIKIMFWVNFYWLSVISRCFSWKIHTLINVLSFRNLQTSRLLTGLSVLRWYQYQRWNHRSQSFPQSLQVPWHQQCHALGSPAWQVLRIVSALQAGSFLLLQLMTPSGWLLVVSLCKTVL